MNDSSRLLTNNNPLPTLCDGSLETDWYRIISDTNTDLMLPTSCTPVLRCQSVSTGWMNGTHPTG